MHLPLPTDEDCAPYYFTYIDQVPGDPLERLRRVGAARAAALERLAPGQVRHRYAPDKWSVADVVGHVLDVERCFAHRAFHIARADPAPLPSFEQEDYARAARYGERSWAEVLAEYRAVRAATLCLFQGLDAAAWGRTGVASGYRFRVSAFPYILAGHEEHHFRILEARYGLALGPAGGDLSGTG